MERRKKHGKFEQFFQNGQLKQSSNYYMGIKQGDEINYYFSGALHSKGSYKNGVNQMYGNIIPMMVF
ncbi:MAG: hypothetical protein CM15mP112_02360 [Flavobacteriales bacterium]|nr:MAG: hypothetical protein CM15mP112_02360 [Flavobacteriales bacterium]